jgi:hypothetical protein
MNRNVLGVIVSMVLFASPPASAGSGAEVSIAATCDKADYAVYEDLKYQGRRLALVGACDQPGSKAIVAVVGDGRGMVIGRLAQNDPGMETFEVRQVAGHDYLVYENAVEPTGDEESHYIAIVDLEHHTSPAWRGELWSFSTPVVFAEGEKPFVGVSINSTGSSRPDAPGWPLAFEIRDTGLVYVTLASVPDHACRVAQALSVRTSSEEAPRATGDSSGDAPGVPASAVARLAEHCTVSASAKPAQDPQAN